MRRCAVLLALLLATAAHGALPGVTELPEPPEAVTDAQLSALLGERTRSADVIAIGETVHGSSGFLRMQARLIRYFVERQGLRLIVWENPALRSLELAQWLASCTRARSAVPIGVLYMPTAADLPLFEWMCEYNAAHPADPLRLRGMDIWDRPWDHYARLRALSAALGFERAPLERVAQRCPAYGIASWPAMHGVYAELQRDGGFRPEDDYALCRAALEGILESARRRGGELRQAGEPAAGDAFELALSASTLLGWLGFYNDNWSDDIRSWNERDRAQARNLMLIMEQAGASRALLSAHTSHVSHGRSPADWWGYGDLKSGVHFYEQMTGRTVFSIALTAHKASGTQGDWLVPTAANSLERTLHEAGHRHAFLHADAPFLSGHRTWWLQNGNAERFENGIELVPRDHFDAYVYFAVSLLDRALPKRDMWEP